MKRSLKLRTKMIKSLVDVLDNEEAFLRKYRLIGKSCGVLGGFVLTFLIISALKNGDSTTAWTIVFSALSGLLIGLSIYFNSSVMQWPIIREFTNVQAIREAAKNEKL